MPNFVTGRFDKDHPRSDFNNDFQVSESDEDDVPKKGKQAKANSNSIFAEQFR